MGGYDDYCMDPPDGPTVAGICHKRGTNESIPGGWMVYITVEDVEAAAQRVVENGGELVVPPKSGEMGSIAIFRDPSGATAALYAPPK